MGNEKCWSCPFVEGGGGKVSGFRLQQSRKENHLNAEVLKSDVESDRKWSGTLAYGLRIETREEGEVQSDRRRGEGRKGAEKGAWERLESSKI